MYHIYEIARSSWDEEHYHVEYFRSSPIGFSPDQQTTFTSASAMWSAFSSEGWEIYDPENNNPLLKSN